MISYEPLWKTMKEKGIATYVLINKNNISSTVNRLRHDLGITTQTIDDLCRIIGCKVEDIIEFIPPENNDK